jgi:hypothetical protein
MSLVNNIYRAGVAVVILLLSVLLFYTPASAQNIDNAITLGITPQLLEITANPGEVVKSTFRLTNASSENLAIRTIPKNFTPNGEEGAVNLTEDDTTYAIARWISVAPETSTVAANKTQDFEVSISVPSNAEPGSHFGSVVFQTIPPENDEAAALVSQEIAPVILVRIAGDTSESVVIEEFKPQSSFYSNENSVELISRIKNTGNVHFKPTGQIVIKNIFGSEVTKLELDKKNVLPDSIRQFVNEWQIDGFKMGRFTAELTLVTGEDNNIETVSTTFIIFPYQIILPIILLLSIFAFIIFKGRKRLAKAAKALSGKDIDNKDK